MRRELLPIDVIQESESSTAQESGALFVMLLWSEMAELISSEVKSDIAEWLKRHGLSQEDVIAYRNYLWGGRQPRQPKRMLSGGTIWNYYSSAKKFVDRPAIEN
jgi:hypothetical protein